MEYVTFLYTDEQEKLMFLGKFLKVFNKQKTTKKFSRQILIRYFIMQIYINIRFVFIEIHYIKEINNKKIL